MSDTGRTAKEWRFYVKDMIDLIWTMVEDAVPKLLPALRHLLETTGEERG